MTCRIYEYFMACRWLWSWKPLWLDYGIHHPLARYTRHKCLLIQRLLPQKAMNVFQIEIWPRFVQCNAQCIILYPRRRLALLLAITRCGVYVRLALAFGRKCAMHKIRSSHFQHTWRSSNLLCCWCCCGCICCPCAPVPCCHAPRTPAALPLALLLPCCCFRGHNNCW